MIEHSFGIIATVGSCFVLVAVLFGAALLVRSRSLRKPKFDSPEAGMSRVSMPPLIVSSSSTLSSTVQPGADECKPSAATSFFTSFWTRTPDLVEDNLETGDRFYLGKVNFTLSYDKENFALQVNLLEAVDLPARDFLTGSSDPYVRVILLPDRREVKVSKVHRRSLNPKFNQTLEFKGHSLKKLHDMTMCMQVMDYDRFSHDDPIGEILLPMKDVKFERKPVYWKHLQEPTVQHKEVRGEIMLSLCYLPESSRLTVVVIKAKELPSKDVTGASDPYVKLWLVHQGNKWEKRKTTIKQATLTPVFNETFSFTVTKDKIQETQLVASVMDYDIIGSNDEIGHVILGKRGSDTGQKHWKDLTEKPGYPLAMWHKLSPKW